MNKYAPPALNLQVQEVSSRDVDIDTLRHEFLKPFAGNYRYMDHIQPEWANPERTGVRLRFFNGGYHPERYYFPSERYCLGILVMRTTTETHFIGEVHKPLPKKEPYRYAIRFTPKFGQVVVKAAKEDKLDVFEDNPNMAEVLDEKDQLQRIADIHDFRERLEIATRYSIYQKAYSLPKGETNRQGTSFELDPRLAREGCRRVDLETEVSRMNAILYSI
jgi:hypothetical protein